MVPVEQEVGQALVPAWTFWRRAESLDLSGIQTLDCRACRQVTTDWPIWAPTILYGWWPNFIRVIIVLAYSMWNLPFLWDWEIVVLHQHAYAVSVMLLGVCNV